MAITLRVDIYFIDDSIQGQQAISCHDRGNKSSTIEPFLDWFSMDTTPTIAIVNIPANGKKD